MVEKTLLISSARLPEKFYSVLSPFSQAKVATIAVAEPAQIEQALQNASSSAKTFKTDYPAHKRADILNKLAEHLNLQQEDYAQTISLEGGKPIKDARVEVKRAIITIKLAARQAVEMAGRQYPMEQAPGSEAHLAFSIREPLGVVLAISAFNHPVNLICHQVCTALAAGNTVIVKPASQTPCSCLKLCSALIDCGLPAEAVSVVTAKGSDLDQLVSDPRINFVSFIGSSAVGWELRRKIAPGTRLSLEHGGTAQAVLASDCDLDQALPALVKGAFYHAGQVCISTQIIYAHENIFEKALLEVSRQAQKLVVGDPLDPATDVGPIINASELERISSWVKTAKDQGAEIITGGFELPGNCYAPTVLVSTSADMLVRSHEIFGPVVCLVPFNNLQSVVSEINSSQFSFQTSIFSKDISLSHNFARSVTARTVLLNEATTFRVDWMPFGGGKTSGLGTGGVEHSMLEMTEEKLIIQKVLNG